MAFETKLFTEHDTKIMPNDKETHSPEDFLLYEVVFEAGKSTSGQQGLQYLCRSEGRLGVWSVPALSISLTVLMYLILPAPCLGFSTLMSLWSELTFFFTAISHKKVVVVANYFYKQLICCIYAKQPVTKVTYEMWNKDSK